MFENIGGKIKGMASFITAAGIIASVIIGLILLFSGIVLIGLIVIVLGSLLAWIGSFLLYGFGQLIENTDIIAEQSNRNNIKYAKSVERQQKQIKEKQRQNAIKKILSEDTNNDEYIDIFCPECNEKLSYFKNDFINNKILTCPMCGKEFSINKIMF